MYTDQKCLIRLKLTTSIIRLIPRLIKSIDYLLCYLKMKKIFFKVLYTKYWSKRLYRINRWQKFFWCVNKKRRRNIQKDYWHERNNDHTTDNLLDYDYFSNHYTLIATDFCRHIKLENPDLKQKIIFIGKLEEDNAATMFFIIEKWQETTF